MKTELFWLMLTLLMTALFWVPIILDRLTVRGLWPAISDSQPESGEQHSLWAKRAMAAHRNAVENLVIFAPAVLAVLTMNISTLATQWAAAAYFFARLVHFVVYSLGTPVVRTLAFAVGWLAQIVLIASVLHWI